MLPKEPLNLKVSKSRFSLVPVKSSCWVNSEGGGPLVHTALKSIPQQCWTGPVMGLLLTASLTAHLPLPSWLDLAAPSLPWKSRVLLVSFQPKYQMHCMAREDILDVLWQSQVTANSIFMGSLMQNNPFGNPDVCLVFTSSFERSCLGSSSASGHPPGTVGTVPSWLGQSAVFSYCKSQTHDEWLEGLFLSQTHGKQQVPLTLQYSR